MLVSMGKLEATMLQLELFCKIKRKMCVVVSKINVKFDTSKYLCAIINDCMIQQHSPLLSPRSQVLVPKLTAANIIDPNNNMIATVDGPAPCTG